MQYLICILKKNMLVQKAFRGCSSRIAALWQSAGICGVFQSLVGLKKSVWAPFLKTAWCAITENLSENYFLSLLFSSCAFVKGREL